MGNIKTPVTSVAIWALVTVDLSLVFLAPARHPRLTHAAALVPAYTASGSILSSPPIRPTGYLCLLDAPSTPDCQNTLSLRRPFS